MASCCGPYQYDSGTYYIRWTDRNRSSRQHIRESLKTKDSETAKDLMRRLKYRYFIEETHDPWTKKHYEKHKSTLEEPLLFEAVEEYISYKQTSRGADSWGDIHSKTGKSILTNFADFVGADKRLDQITKEDIGDFLHRDGINSDHTRLTYHRDIRAFFNWSKKQGFIETIPDFKPKKPQQDEPKDLTTQQLLSICNYHLTKLNRNIQKGYVQKDKTTHWMPLAWWLLARTGLRPGELFQLKTSHIDLEEGIIKVGVDFITKVRKTRGVPILGNARQILELLLDEEVRRQDRYMAKSNLLLGREGKQAQRRLSDKFREARRAVLPEKDFNLYHLKDTFAVWFFTEQTEFHSDHVLLQLMGILGHSEVETTRRYLNLDPYNLTKI